MWRGSWSCSPRGCSSTPARGKPGQAWSRLHISPVRGRTNLHAPSRSLPVLRTADVAVLGGSFAGIAIALELRRARRRVVLIEPRTYLGREITATLRPWVTIGQRSALWTLLLERMGLEPERMEIPLHMDRLKLSLEDLLLDAGIDLLYASRPVQVLSGPDGVHGVVIANKSGRQVVRAPTLVDATETAVGARLAGGRPVRPRRLPRPSGLASPRAPRADGRTLA